MTSKVWSSSSPGLSSKRDSYSIVSVPPSSLTDLDDEDRSRQSWRTSSPEEFDVANSPNDLYYTQDPIASPTSSLGKGKGRQLNDDQNAGPTDQAFNPDLISLEPLDDDEVETIRVQENLRRWEQAERQRRKAARTSTNALPVPAQAHTSIVGDVASYLWPPRFAVSHHAALQSHESMDFPLTDLTSPNPHSPPDSRSPTPTPDPFANPPPTTKQTHPDPNPSTPTPISPFDDAHAPAPNDLTTKTQTTTTNLDIPPNPRDKHPRSRVSRPPPPPPPLPLGLPPPRTPPPAIDTSAEAIPSPSTPNGSRPVKPWRWWHEWLCGCGEGPDRGGDYQAGRTNPFE